MYKFHFFLFLNLLILCTVQGQSKVLYLIPGQGSDGALFQNLELDSVEVRILEYTLPSKGASMAEYAHQMAEQIDTCGRFSILGVSLGGMLAVEMDKFLDPEEIILIASAKTRQEIPRLYRSFQKVPIYKIIGGRSIIFWTWILQPIMEPLDKSDQKLWRRMLKAKDPVFMKRVIACIVEWENEYYDVEKVYHIHGERDRTLPIDPIQNPIVISGGTHIMTLTRGAEISAIVNALID
jgi:pimeloyl-ACP methyl ester carboxylesterase